MSTQIAAWFTGSIDTHKLQMFDDFSTIGAELLQQPPPRSYGFGDRESVRLQGWPVWFGGHDCHIDGVQTEIHEICVMTYGASRQSSRRPRKHREHAIRDLEIRRGLLQLFSRIIAYPECVEATYGHTSADFYPKFAPGRRLGSIVVCGDDEPIEHPPGSLHYWAMYDPQLVWAATKQFGQTSELETASQWAARNRALVHPCGNGWLFDCGYTTRWPSGADEILHLTNTYLVDE